MASAAGGGIELLAIHATLVASDATARFPALDVYAATPIANLLVSVASVGALRVPNW
jgi:hypothetical protein